MKCTAILPLLLFLGPALRADDEVKLKNGDRVSGKLLQLAKGKLHFQTPHSGKLAIDWGQVTSVRSDVKVRVLLATGEVLEGKLSTSQEGKLRVETEGPVPPVDVEFAKVTRFNEAPAQWHGNVNLAVRATDGNTHTTSFLAAGEATRETEKDLILLRSIFRYGERSGHLQERNSYALAKYLYRIYEGLYVYASAEILSDRFKDLRLGTVMSVGAGYEVVKEPWGDLAVEAGLAYFDNNFREGKDESHMGGRFSARLRLALPLGFELKDLFTYYPNFEDSADWQIRNEATLGTALGGGWNLLGGVITEFDNEPPEGLEEYDNTYFVGLGFTF
jgi:putative salt-induced outer membrane protein YdiY